MQCISGEASICSRVVQLYKKIIATSLTLAWSSREKQG